MLTSSRTVEASGASFGPFTCDQYGLAWVLEGGGVTHLDGCALQTRPGSVLLMRPGMVLTHQWGDAPSMQCFFVFSMRGEPRGWPAPSSWPALRHYAREAPIFALWRSLFERSVSPAEAVVPEAGIAGAELVVPGVELLLRMVVQGEGGHVRTPRLALPEAVERALSLIHAHVQARPAEALRLTQLARGAGVSAQHLCRSFKRALGLSPMKCAQAARLERAATALEQSEQGLAEIAHDHGFSSAFHFSRAFKQSYGTAPDPYRRAFREGRAVRPSGLAYRHHALRHYLYERSPGEIPMP